MPPRMAISVGAGLVKGSDYGIRAIQPEDRPWVTSAWLRDARLKSNWGRWVNAADFNPIHSQVIDLILARGKCLVAFDLAEPSVIWAFLAYEPGVLHYVLTKKAFRRLGLALALWGESGLPETAICSHLTSTGQDLLHQLKPRVRFIPHAIGGTQ